MYYVCAIEGTGEVSGDLTGEMLGGLAGWLALVGGCEDRVGVAGSGSGSGSGHRDCNAAQHHLVNTVTGLLVQAVRLCATALTEGNNKTGTKKKRTYMLDYAMHAQLVHGDGPQITQFCSRCRQMID